MKKRLRKKKHRGQFKEYGWYVDYRFESASNELEDYFWDLLINQVESLGLMIGGSTVSFFATLEKASLTVVQERREQLHHWLTQQPGIADVTSSPLTDAWYGPFEK